MFVVIVVVIVVLVVVGIPVVVAIRDEDAPCHARGNCEKNCGDNRPIRRHGEPPVLKLLVDFVVLLAQRIYACSIDTIPVKPTQSASLRI
jgi:hypothetical protein